MSTATPVPQHTALVIGAGGGLGHEVTRALLRHGWRVRALIRDPAKAAAGAASLGDVECVVGDAAQRVDVVAAAQGAGVIVHAVNPPRYRNWRELAIPMLRNAIEAARASGARLMFPGNVYNFDPQVRSPIVEGEIQRPRTRKGVVRAEMEGMLQAASQEGVRAIVIRAGDFFGGHAPSSNFSNILVRPGRPLRSIVYPGSPMVGHAWAYLPDLAETFAEIADREQELPAFETFHFAGHWLTPGIEMAHAIQRASGNPRLPIRGFPWLAVALLSPFVTLFREVLEMRYLWRQPLALDNSKLVGLLGREPRTPLDQAITDSLREMGCLEPAYRGA